MSETRNIETTEVNVNAGLPEEDHEDLVTGHQIQNRQLYLFYFIFIFMLL
jgi:hypothetical protein